MKKSERIFKERHSINIGDMIKARAIGYRQCGDNPEMEKYSKKYNKINEEKEKLLKEYLDKHDLNGKSIYSTQHPEYFKIEERYNKLLKKLNEPILSKAYYKIGEEIVFVEKDEHINEERKCVYGKPLLQKDKVIYNVVDIKHPEKESKSPMPLYYQNKLISAPIERIEVTNSGAIKYGCTPYYWVLESDVINNLGCFKKMNAPQHPYKICKKNEMKWKKNKEKEGLSAIIKIDSVKYTLNIGRTDRNGGGWWSELRIEEEQNYFCNKICKTENQTKSYIIKELNNHLKNR